MDIIIERFHKLKLIDKFFLGMGLLLFIFWLYSTGIFHARIDDWCYNVHRNKNSLPLSNANIILCLSLTMPLIPWLFRNVLCPAGRYLAKPGTKNFSIAEFLISMSIISIMVSASLPQFAAMTEGRIEGYSAGGAKNIDNFRENIKKKYLPQENDITYNGLFYDYYFNICGNDASEKPLKNEAPVLFRPVYSWLSSKNPITGSDETFITIGLRSDMDLSKIKRKKLNLVVVLDISGSMSSAFDEYYYDRFAKNNSNYNKGKDSGRSLSKLAVACRSIAALTDRLNPEDRLGIVLFDQTAYTAKRMREISKTDVDALKTHILALEAGGGTNMEEGLKTGGNLLNDYGTLDPEKYENRIIFMTDAMPNLGNTKSSEFLAITSKYAAKRIYSTFIGIGLDFNADLVELITRIRGANYYSVHSSAEFKKRLNLEFDYMVNPLLFNMEMSFSSERWSIAEVYGSPEADNATGRLMKVNTLFPAPASENGVKGGVIVLKLFDKGEGGDEIKLKITYEKRSGKVETISSKFLPPYDTAAASAEKDSRKAVLLARYAGLMKSWIRAETYQKCNIRPKYDERNGLNEWERLSSQMTVQKDCRDIISKFMEHFDVESQIIGDRELDREREVMASLLNYDKTPQ